MSLYLNHGVFINVKNAFLHGNLEQTVYMHQPPRFRNPQFPDHVCLLKKFLYGFKQAPCAWYQRFTDYVATMSFSHSVSDHSLFIYHHGNDIVYILLYVDDIILDASSDTLRSSIMAQLSSEFAMKDLGPLSYFLGVSVTRHSEGIFLSQKKYVEEIIERFGMSSCKPPTTPIDEYRGVANVVAESCWLHNLLLKLCCHVTKAILVYCANISAVYLSDNPVQHQRTKHIEIWIYIS
ncbi:unnamed protein product [Trifolium pratense]|uniref:Uncharacterized protein n=1 Tax=Trifolium pratense TaxID=57577 RepID=A0ACB0IUZ7_TRIPR|nr:unnamed protein product [Trifolium pratense]